MATRPSKFRPVGAAAGIFADMSIDGPEIGTLVVIVDRAKNLPNRRTMGKQDPYCAARLGKEAKKTETDKRGGQTPRWDQELRFTVHDSPDYYSLKVSVFNDDKKTELIGETFIRLDNVIIPGGGQSDTWHPLNCKGKYAGDIRIELTYYDLRPKPELPLEKRRESAKPTIADGQSPGAVGGPREATPVKRRPLPSGPGNGSSSSSPVGSQSQPRGHHTPVNAGPRSYHTPTRPAPASQASRSEDHTLAHQGHGKTSSRHELREAVADPRKSMHASTPDLTEVAHPREQRDYHRRSPVPHHDTDVALTNQRDYNRRSPVPDHDTDLTFNNQRDVDNHYAPHPDQPAPLVPHQHTNRAPMHVQEHHQESQRYQGHPQQDQYALQHVPQQTHQYQQVPPQQASSHHSRSQSHMELPHSHSAPAMPSYEQMMQLQLKNSQAQPRAIEAAPYQPRSVDDGHIRHHSQGDNRRYQPTVEDYPPVVEPLRASPAPMSQPVYVPEEQQYQEPPHEHTQYGMAYDSSAQQQGPLALEYGNVDDDVPPPPPVHRSNTTQIVSHGLEQAPTYQDFAPAPLNISRSHDNMHQEAYTQHQGHVQPASEPPTYETNVYEPKPYEQAIYQPQPQHQEQPVPMALEYQQRAIAYEQPAYEQEPQSYDNMDYESSQQALQHTHEPAPYDDDYQQQHAHNDSALTTYNPRPGRVSDASQLSYHSSRPVSRDTMAPSPLRQESVSHPLSLVPGVRGTAEELTQHQPARKNSYVEPVRKNSYNEPIRKNSYVEPERKNSYNEQVRRGSYNEIEQSIEPSRPSSSYREPATYSPALQRYLGQQDQQQTPPPYGVPARSQTFPRPEPGVHDQLSGYQFSSRYTQEPSPSRDAGSLIKPRAVSPAGARTARMPNRSTPTRKSVSPRPPTANTDFGERRLSGVPFSPDSFDELNPNIRSKSAASSMYGNSGSNRGGGVDDDAMTIISFDGRVVDPSDHLPVDSWAPEPERKTGSKSNPSRDRERPTGGRDLRPRSRGDGTIRSAVHNVAGYSSSHYGGPGMNNQDDEMNSYTGAVQLRNRLQNRSRPSSIVDSLSTSPGSTFDSRNALVKSPTANRFSPSPGYSSSGYGSRNAPPIPAKIPLRDGGSPAYGGGNDEMSRLSMEMSQIEIGLGNGSVARRSRRY